MTRCRNAGAAAGESLLTCGKGQRIGLFGGSGVGKSTLLGMIARNVRSDINVIALIGERGREVLEFVERNLGPEGLRRSVVVVATSDQPALTRCRAAHPRRSFAQSRATLRERFKAFDSWRRSSRISSSRPADTSAFRWRWRRASGGSLGYLARESCCWSPTFRSSLKSCRSV